MNPKQITNLSRFLSLVLRHEPQKIGIQLDASGWVSTDELIAGCHRHGMPITSDLLREIVATNDKKRFALSEDGLRIRANQGHSVEVELGLSPAVPPETLYHGTVERFLDSIWSDGLKKGERHHVHLSAEEKTALKVGERRGQPVILRVAASQMHADGYTFHQTANGVWLTDHVPPQYIT